MLNIRMGQVPEVIRERRPKEGPQPDGSIRMGNGVGVGDGFDLALLTDGVEFSFDHPRSVAQFLQVLALQVRLTEKHAETLGKEHVVESFAHALTNSRSFSEDEDEKLFARFVGGAVIRFGSDIDFANQ